MATATQVTIQVVIDCKNVGPAVNAINHKLGEIGPIARNREGVEEAASAIRRRRAGLVVLLEGSRC